jgi:hypothetical protein
MRSLKMEAEEDVQELKRVMRKQAIRFDRLAEEEDIEEELGGELMIQTDRKDMTIDTLDFNTKPGEIIPIDDVDTRVIEPYILTKEESRLKESIWKYQNADYLA